jgi:hypothetical protein
MHALHTRFLLHIKLFWYTSDMPVCIDQTVKKDVIDNVI